MATNHQFSVGNKPKRKGDQKANADELPGDAVRRCCSDDGGCVVADVPTKAKKRKKKEQKKNRTVESPSAFQQRRLIFFLFATRRGPIRRGRTCYTHTNTHTHAHTRPCQVTTGQPKPQGRPITLRRPGALRFN